MSERRRKVENLLHMRFPVSWVAPPLGEDGSSHAQMMAAIQAQRDELLAKSEQEIDVLYAAMVESLRAKAKAKADIEERGRFFNKPEATANFTYWSKVEYWTLDESLALLFGKSPEVVTWKAIEPYVHISTFAKQYERLRNLAMRAQAMNRGQSVYPSAVLGWAKQMDIPVPDDLQAALARQWAKGQAGTLAEAPQVVQMEQPTSIGQEPEPEEALTDTTSTLTTIDTGPSLFTDEICDAFAGLGMNSIEWRTALTKNRPRWLRACLASLGRTGANPVQGRWYPLKIATALVTGESRKAGVVPAIQLDAAFRRKPVLRPFAEAWADLRADHPAWASETEDRG